jgi:hypothetical protein
MFVFGSLPVGKTRRGWRFFLAAAFCALPGFLSPARAGQASPFSGTVWVSTKNDGGATATMSFRADGTWGEKWKRHHHKGHWIANEDNTQVVVTEDDHHVFHFRLNADKTLVRGLGSVVYVFSRNLAGAEASEAVGASPASSQRTAPTVKLTEDQAREVVLIKGDHAQGTGFLIKTPDGPVVVTNIHVISNNPNLKITTNSGAGPDDSLL